MVCVPGLEALGHQILKHSEELAGGYDRHDAAQSNIPRHEIANIPTQRGGQHDIVFLVDGDARDRRRKRSFSGTNTKVVERCWCGIQIESAPEVGFRQRPLKFSKDWPRHDQFEDAGGPALEDSTQDAQTHSASG